MSFGQPGSIGSMVPPDAGWIAREFADIRRILLELMAARVLGDGVSSGPDGVNSDNFDGTLNPAAAGTQGWGLAGPTGDAIFNNLYLRGGIIGDDALTNPIQTAVLNTQSADTITYGVSLAPVLSGSLTVPAGFSQALVMATATAIGYLDFAHSTQQCAVNVQLHVGSTTGPELPSAGNDVQTPACQANTSHSALLAGVSGTVPVSLYANGLYCASGTGTASLAAIAIFLR